MPHSVSEQSFFDFVLPAEAGLQFDYLGTSGKVDGHCNYQVPRFKSLAKGVNHLDSTLYKLQGTPLPFYSGLNRLEHIPLKYLRYLRYRVIATRTPGFRSVYDLSDKARQHHCHGHGPF